MRALCSVSRGVVHWTSTNATFSKSASNYGRNLPSAILRARAPLGLAHGLRQSSLPAYITNRRTSTTMSAATDFKSEHEGKLLQVSKDFNGALSSRSTDKLDSILDDSVTVHKDGITLGEDLSGKAAVKSWLGAYIDKYSFTHEVIAGAVDEQAQVTFSFWQDKDVKPASGKFDEDLPDSAKVPSRTVGIWHLQLDPAGAAIKHIWFLRQLSADEAHRKLKENIPQGTKFDPEDFKGSGVSPAAERAKRNEEVAAIFSDMYKAGDASRADEIFAEDVVQYHPVLGHEMRGKDAWKQMMEGFAKSWDITTQENRIAVTASDKAFIWWYSTMVEKDSGKKDTMYGLNMLRINEAGKIQAVIGFRQLTGSESEKYIKDSVQR